MRRLLICACVCTTTLSGSALVTETPLPPAPAATTPTSARHTAMPSDDIDGTGFALVDIPQVDISHVDIPLLAMPAENEQQAILGSHETPDGEASDGDAGDFIGPPPPPPKPVVHRSREEVCATLVTAAEDNNLPAPFFIRLLLQESGFRPGVVSPVGAQGVAQFMPATAAQMGLDNPFDPLQAIPASARLLRMLFERFGNLGLAAAAYNAGPKRIQDWLASKGRLPGETRGYVKTITGRDAETWKDEASAGIAGIRLPRVAPCQREAGLHAWDGPEAVPLPPPSPRTQALVVAATEQPAQAAPAAAQNGGIVRLRKAGGGRVTAVITVARRGRAATTQLTARHAGKTKTGQNKTGQNKTTAANKKASRNKKTHKTAAQQKPGAPLQLARTPG